MKLWTCTRADLRRGGAALVLLVLIAGLAGGVTLAAVAGARRTTTSFDRLRAAERGAEVFLYSSRELTPAELATLRRIPRAKVRASTIIILLPGPTGIDRRNDLGLIVASDAESMAMLRPHHLEGRMPSPEHPEEVLVNELVASELHLEPGDSVDLIGPTDLAFGCLMALECDGPLVNNPIRAVVTGVIREAGDLDPDAFNGALVHAGPGMNDLAPDGYVRALTVADVKLDDGFAGVDAFRTELERRFPPPAEGPEETASEDEPLRLEIEVDDPNESNIDRTLDVEARSLLVFALFAGAAGLVATAQAFARHLAAGGNERRVLAALGLTSRDRTILMVRTGLLVVVGATVVAMLFAVLGSAFLPVGVAGRAEPYPGIDVDELVLLAGGATMAAVLLLSFAGLAWRAARRDGNAAVDTVRGRAGRLAGLPLVPALGVDFAAPRIRRAGGASTVGALVGVIAALAAATAAVVVSASNHRLQMTPQLYGQPWDANASLGAGTARPVAEKLSSHPDLAALAIARGASVELSGPTGASTEGSAVAIDPIKGEMEPSILAGRAPRSADEVALGSKLFGALDVTIGDSVSTSEGAQLRVVGRAIIPIVEGDFPDSGALFTMPGFERHVLPDDEEAAEETGEVHVAFDVRPGVDLDQTLEEDLGPAIALAGASARKPSDVTTLAGVGRFPGAIGLFTAVLAVAALVHALLVVARRRRRDLVTLRALGLRRRQSAAAVLWAGGTVFGVGLLVGLPLGLAIGRLVWQAIADSINVVPSPAVPGIPVVLVVAGGAVAALAAAAWPALAVRRLRLADALRAE